MNIINCREHYLVSLCFLESVQVAGSVDSCSPFPEKDGKETGLRPQYYNSSSTGGQLHRAVQNSGTTAGEPC